jgi:hypothetical protein
MQPELAAELKSHVATKSSAAPVFDLPHESSMARVLRSDLAEARKHWLALAGVHPKTVQVIMRHSSITLTMDTYGHLFPGQEVDAVAQMQTLLADPVTQPEVLRATGTDDLRVDGQRTAQRQAQRAKRDDRLRCRARMPKRGGWKRKRLSQCVLLT